MTTRSSNNDAILDFESNSIPTVVRRMDLDKRQSASPRAACLVALVLLSSCLNSLQAGPDKVAPTTAAAEAQAEAQNAFPKWWGYSHAEPTMMAGADLYKMLRTPAGQQLRQRFLEAIGAEVSGTLESVLLSVGEDEANKSERLLIFSGRIHAKQMRDMAAKEGASVRMVDKVLVIAPADAGPKDGHFAIIDDRIALAGTWNAITAALSRHRQIGVSASAANSIFSRAAAASQAYEAWVVSDEVPQGLLPAGADRAAEEGEVSQMRIGVSQSPVPQIEFSFASEPDATSAAVAEWTALQSTSRTESKAGAKSRYLLREWLPVLQPAARPNQFVLSALLDRRGFLEKWPRLASAVGLPIVPAEFVATPKPAAPPPAPLGPMVSKLLLNSDLGLAHLPGPPKNLGRVRILGLDEGEQTFELQR